ncbi:kinase-like domain-containing protein [Whalleya microplaca]|nr:kinase-like domain-containing protein [Whalleya microplaca]
MELEDVEPLEHYCPGGYHPILVGQRLNDRYRIVHKLGYGSYSTTWLSWDEKSSTYVAIKIGVAEAEYQNESHILRLLVGTDSDTNTCPGKAFIPKLLDDFNVQGPNGTHRCLVTTPARMSISDAREASYKRLFKPAVARAIAAQLVQAVAFLHSRGVVHSDLHEGNILLGIPKSLDSLPPDKLYEKYSYPELEKIERLDGQPLDVGVPTHVVVPIWLGSACEDVSLDESGIFLTDFGESFLSSTTVRYHSHTPLILRAPEQLFAPLEPLSLPTDIWALACALFAVLGQRPLFESWFPTSDRVIEEHADALGRLPMNWWTNWPSRNDYFKEESLERVDGEVRRHLEERVEYAIYEPRRKYGTVDAQEPEKIALTALLKSMLTFRPEDRPTARQVAESDWMVKWALPELYKVRRMPAAEAIW